MMNEVRAHEHRVTDGVKDIAHIDRIEGALVCEALWHYHEYLEERMQAVSELYDNLQCDFYPAGFRTTIAPHEHHTEDDEAV